MSVVVSPRRLTRVCWAVSVLVVLVFGALAVLLPRGDTDQQLTVLDQVAFFGIGLVLAAAALAFTRARVRADGHGVRVRNVLGERFFPWGVVVGVHLPEGAGWASLELHDDETVALLAIQANDGDTAVEAVLALRDLMHTAQDTQT